MTETVLYSEVVEHAGTRATVKIVLVHIHRVETTNGVRGAFWLAERRVTNGFPKSFVSKTKRGAVQQAQNWIDERAAFRATLCAEMAFSDFVGDPV